MAKKKTKQRNSNELPRPALTPEISPKVDYYRPLSSPYESPFVTLVIGSKRYGIPAQFLQNHPKLAVASLGSSTIFMSDIDEDVGHTVVHFLHTGGYETVNSPLDEGTSDLAREYKRSVLVYHASRIWSLADLEVLSRQKMQHLDEELPVLEILRIMRGVFSSLPADETWLPDYIQGNLQRSLRPNDPGLGLQEFYNVIGQDHQFDNAVMKMIIEILSIRIFSMKEQQVKTPNGIVSSETPLQGPVPEEPETVPEEPETVPEEPETVPEEPETVPEDTQYPPEGPELVPEETGYPPEEPEASPWGLPTEAENGFSVVPRAPAELGDWPHASLLPEDTPNAELIDASGQGHIARISRSDLTLYDDWESLSSKRKAKRASKLRSRGLPVPSETGFIAIVAD